MSSLWSTPTIVLWLLTWLAAPPSSLGEAALKESIRRQATTKSTATLTNLGRELSRRIRRANAMMSELEG